jgi:hypothetical protein
MISIRNIAPSIPWMVLSVPLIYAQEIKPTEAGAIRLDEQEAPQREIDRQKKADDEDRATQQKARLANRPDFRP